MAKSKSDTATLEAEDSATATGSIEEQAAQQTGTRQVRLRIDQSDLHTCYANAFRTNATAEEVIVDFGLNQVVSAQRQQTDATDADGPSGEIVFQLSNRVILNYYSAKRLVLTLGQLIRRYEDQFGELKLNVSDRTKNGSSV